MFSVKVIWVCFWSGWLLQQTLKSLIRTRFLKVHINRESYRDVFRRYHFKFFKGCLPQIFLGPFLNTFDTYGVRNYSEWLWKVILKFFSEGIQKDLRLFKPDRYQNMAKYGKIIVQKNMAYGKKIWQNNPQNMAK